MKLNQFLKSLIFIVSMVWWVGVLKLQASAYVIKEPTSQMTDITSDFTQKEAGKISWPIKNVSADYVRNGEVTEKTTKLAITLKNSEVKLPSVKKWRFLQEQLLGANGTVYGLNTMKIDPKETGWSSERTDVVNVKGLVSGDEIWIGNKTEIASDQRESNGSTYIRKDYVQRVSQITLKPKIDSVNNKANNITGRGTQAGDQITVTIGNVTRHTKVTDNGRWAVSLDGQKTQGKVIVTESDGFGDTPGTTSSTAMDKHISQRKNSDSDELGIGILSGKNVEVTPGDSTSIEGYVYYSGSHSISNSNVMVHVTLDNGNVIPDFKLNGSSDGSSEEGFWNLNLVANKLSPGINNVTLWVTDSDGDISLKETVQVTLTGVLKFDGISTNIEFQSTEIPARETLINSLNDWKVNVSDSRKKGSKWYVYANATKMQSTTHILNGNLVYIDSAGNKSNLTNQSTLIESGSSNGTTDGINITKDWSSKKGIFLDVQPNIYAGNYSGKINWSLQDTPQK